MSRQPPRALLLNGTVGVGKTTVAEAVGDLLREAGAPHGVIDVDALRHAWPAPPGDRFHLALGMRNLAAVAANHLAAGSDRLVAAGVVETQAERHAHEQALGVPVTVVRLRVQTRVLRARLEHRHADDPDSLAWHLRRAPELDAILDAATVDDHSLDVTTTTPAQAAAEIVRTLGW
jgi:chloramphenicol 3-O-phosphotransferase